MSDSLEEIRWTFRWYMFLLALFILPVIMFCLYAYDSMHQEPCECPEYIKFQGDNSSNYAGVYFPGETFCVYMGNRTNQEIYNTTCHEACHSMVHNDYDHFCWKGGPE